MLGLVSLKKATFVLETKYNKNSNKSNCFYFFIYSSDSKAECIA